MLTYYLNGGPNPLKTTLFLEEAGIAYRPVFVDVFAGEQFEAPIAALNPNCKVPVIVEADGTVVFDSAAILLYLGEKHRRFCPGPSDRGTLLSWMLFIASGLGPYSGQAVHFQHAAPESLPYAVSRYRYEAARHFGIIDRHLANRRFMMGDEYSIVDMALWGWATFLSHILGQADAAAFTNVNRLVEEVNARPAAHRARSLVARPTGRAPVVKGNRYLFGHLPLVRPWQPRRFVSLILS